LSWVPLVASQWSTTTVVPEPSGTQCYQFTWKKQNNATECNMLKAELDVEYPKVKIPCFQPIIWTEPSSSPPNITALNDYCDSASCPKYNCTKPSSQCLKWVMYDVRGRAAYLSVFCGNMVDVTGGANIIQYSRSYSNASGTHTTVVSTCSRDYCNYTAGGMQALMPGMVTTSLSLGLTCLFLLK